FSNTIDDKTTGTAIAGATNSDYQPLTDAIGETFYYVEISFTSGGCDKIVSSVASVNVVEQLNIDPVTPTQTICVGGTADEFEVTFSGGTGSPFYQWYANTTNSNSGGNLINGATSSTYTPPVFTTVGDFFFYAEVSLDGNGCTIANSDVFEVQVLADPIIDTQPIASQELCANAIPTDLTVAVSGGTASAKNYQWFINTNNNTTSGNAISGANAPTYSPETSTIGTFYYYVVVSQPESDCTVVSDVSALTVNPSPIITTQPISSEVCLDGTATTLEVAYTNGTGTPSYQWFSNTIDDKTTGTAIAGATSATYDPPTNSVGTTYYYAEISFSSGGCSKITSDTARVKINGIPVISNASITIYSEATFTFDPSDITTNTVPTGTQYIWSAPTFNPAGSILGATAETNPQNTISQTLENVGTSPIVVSYTITPATPTCTGTPFTLEVTVNPNISSNAMVTNITCFEVNDGAISTTIEGGIPFSSGNPYLISWTGPNGFSSTNATITNLAAGTYNLRIEDSTGFFITEEWIVTQPDLLTITKEKEQNISCFQGNDGAIEVRISGGTNPYTFNWTTTNGSGIIAGVKNQNTLTAGTYILEVIDQNNCVTSTSFILTEPEGLAITTADKQNVLCFGDASGSISLNVTGGTKSEVSPGVFDYIYNWSGPNGFTSSSKNINNLIAGVYTVAVTDNLGCTTSSDITINESPEIIINYTKTDVSCYGANDGVLEVTVEGGAAPYQISWSNFGNGFTQSNLEAGTYVATITDANNCVEQVSIEINQPLFFIDPDLTPISCNGANDGSIRLNLTGGIAPIRVTWDDDPSAGVQRNNLSAGTYKVTIIDSDPNQCPIEETFVFTNPPAIAVSSTVTDAIDCDIENSGSIDLTISGGTAPYSFNWSNGATTEDLQNISKGDYTVTISDANGCSVSRQFSIFRNDPIKIDFIESFITDCNTKTVNKKIEAVVSGGFLPHTLSWSSGNVSGINNNIMTTAQTGSYILTVTDNNGCTYNKSILINNIPVIGDQDFRYNAFALSNYDLLSIEDPIEFTNLSSGNYNAVQWDFGDGSPIVKENNPIHTYDSVGNYTVKLTIEYETGCIYTIERDINITIGYTLINPNAFTPNNDGYNETIRPNFKGFTEIEMNIYDNWGTLVYFEKGTSLKGWDGTIKNTLAENGNYIMVVKGITFYNKVITTSTPITLLK
ncbi:PKD domain-containing protein, partial [Polaribacter marinivivus]|uniref:PKD domain-containing protein n=1 Tax=Polaribacter marinivivus TaxID=1524260 RepID=UPI003D336FB4